MIDWKASRRRFLVVAVALAAAAVVLRGDLSTMLVARGDALAYAGDPNAGAMYERALLFDPANAVAADRTIFRAILSHDRAHLRTAVAEASRELALRPRDATIEMDRALCLQLLGDVKGALADFSEVGARTKDPRALLFAADDAVSLGRLPRARTLLRLAVEDDPGFRPAVRALDRVRATP